MTPQRLATLTTMVALALSLGGLGTACDKTDAQLVSPTSEVEKPKKTLDCKGKDWSGCFKKGMDLTREDGVKAFALLSQVCDAPMKVAKGGSKSSEACYEAGKLLSKGAPGLERSIAKSSPWHVKGCNADNADSCDALGAGYMTKDFGPPNDKEAQKYLQKACDLGKEYSCSMAKKLTVILLKGREENWPKLCDGGKGRSCLELGMRHYREKTPKAYLEAAGWFTKGCDLAEPLACDVLAQLYNTKLIEGGVDKATEAWTKGCALKSSYNCSTLGLLHHTRKKYKAAAAAFQSACDIDGDRVACASLGQLLLSGKGVKADKVAARVVLVKACDAGEDSSCKQVRELDGKGGKKKK